MERGQNIGKTRKSGIIELQPKDNKTITYCEDMINYILKGVETTSQKDANELRNTFHSVFDNENIKIGRRCALRTPILSRVWGTGDLFFANYG